MTRRRDLQSGGTSARAARETRPRGALLVAHSATGISVSILDGVLEVDGSSFGEGLLSS